MAKSREPSIRSVKSPEAIAALRSWLGKLDETTRERGQEYFERGHAEQVWADADHFVEAVVAGQQLYSVQLFLTRGHWSSRCSCPIHRDCKHACAAALAWIAEVESSSAAGADLAPVRPTRPVAFPGAAATAPGRRKSFSDEWSPVLAKKLGRPLTPAELRKLSQLSALFNEFSQSFSTLYPGALERHGFAYTLEAGQSFYSAAFPGWWTHRNPPADPWALWQFIAYHYEQHGREIRRSSGR